MSCNSEEVFKFPRNSERRVAQFNTHIHKSQAKKFGAVRSCYFVTPTHIQ